MMDKDALISIDTEASSCGCCSTSNGPNGTAAVDPVCGMTVDPPNAKATSTHGGQTFYFCAEGCRRSFDKNPTSFLTSTD
jgi:P-type Cu+ transporter